MANKSFGTKQLDLTGASGSPIITSPSDLSINATTVAISTNISVGGYFASNVNVGTGYSVGIGTTIPATKLEVRDGSILVDAFGSTGDNGIFFRKDYINADSSSYNLSILAYDHANTGSDFHKDGLSINAYDGISFCTGSNTRDEKLRITSDGKVGIGTTIPGYNLDIKDGTSGRVAIDVTGGSDAAIWMDGMNADFAGSDYWGLKAQSTGEFALFKASSEKLRIDSDGKVLVGVTTAEGSRSNTSTRYPFIQFSSAWDGGRGTGSFTCTDDYPILFINSNATYQDNAGAGTLTFSVKDGAGNYCNTAEIKSQIDGTPGNNDSPGDLTFLTTPDGSAQPTAALTLTARGDVVCNGSPAYFRLPRVTTAQKNALSAVVGGEMVYDTDENAVYFYQNTVGWRVLQHSS